MKTFILILMFAISVRAAGPELLLHLECKSDNCSEASGQTETIRIEIEPALRISSEDVEEALLTQNEYGMDELNVQLKAEAAEKFAKVTETAINSRLAVVVDGDLIAAPRVMQSILGGRFIITAGGENNLDFIEKIPWLEKMVQEKTSSKANWDLVFKVLYALAVVLLLGIAVFWTIVKKSRQSRRQV